MKKLKLRVKWKETSLEDFVALHAEDFTRAEFFLQTSSPLNTGTEVGFEFLLADGRSFFEGRGVVSEVGSHSGRPGMTIRHTELSEPATDLLATLLTPTWDEHTPAYPIDPGLLTDQFDEDTATGLEEDALEGAAREGPDTERADLTGGER